MRPIALATLALLIAPAVAHAFAGPFAADSAPAPRDTARAAQGDTMVFTPAPAESSGHEWSRSLRLSANEESDWLRAPIGSELLTHPDPWRSRHPRRPSDFDLTLDYNRVDLVRYGGWWQLQSPSTMYPRLGTRLEYATGRKRVLYGVLLEQPLLPTARFVLGASMDRRTAHYDLQQVDDVENSLTLLAAHEDWRDYFEREGFGAYLAWRVPDFSTISVHARRDDYRSLTSSPHVHSWWNVDRELRPNPAIDDGESHALFVRLERLAHRTQRTHAGIYHWIEVERSGGPMGGDFDYTRALADVRSVVRVTPGSSFALRAVGGAAIQGALPRQKRFAIGGVDGLRGHPFGAFQGDHMALVQAEYSIGLWSTRQGPFEEGVHALAFTDAGTAWDDPHHGWAAGGQHFAVDGGFGVATSEDGMRVTLARNLQETDSSFVVSLRLNRPF